MALERALRESLRWHVLEVLDAARPDWLSELILLASFSSGWPGVTRDTLRREVDYLRLAGLLTVEVNTQGWLLKPTREGVDVVEYTVGCPAGIARPVK